MRARARAEKPEDRLVPEMWTLILGKMRIASPRKMVRGSTKAGSRQYGHWFPHRERLVPGNMNTGSRQYVHRGSRKDGSRKLKGWFQEIWTLVRGNMIRVDRGNRKAGSQF